MKFLKELRFKLDSCKVSSIYEIANSYEIPEYRVWYGQYSKYFVSVSFL